MASIKVIEYQITTSYTGYPNWTVGRKICVYLNDSSFTYSVKIQEGDSVIETPTSGPFLYNSSGGNSVVITAQPYYQWCSGTTLNKVSSYTSFPYATTLTYANHNDCQIGQPDPGVCDIQISNDVVVEFATDESTNDGTITVSSTSSHGPIRYGIKIGPITTIYATNIPSGSTYTFTGLLPNSYQIVAIDSNDCRDSINVFVGVGGAYPTKYYGEYDCLDGSKTRIEIGYSAYAGEEIEVCFGDTPAVLTYEDSDKFSPYIACHIDIQLKSNFYGDFQELFTQGDRDWQVRYYKDFGDGLELKFIGFIVTQFFSQPFVRSNLNIITFTASDQIGTLKDDLFRDSGGNKYRGSLSQLFTIRELLAKTGLKIPICVADNVYDEGMSLVDDPFSDVPLSEWDNVSTGGGYVWSIDSTPSVSVGAGIGLRSSDLLRTDVSVPAGTYSLIFDITTGGGGSPTVRFRFRKGGVSVGTSVVIPPSPGNYSGTSSITLTDSADSFEVSIGTFSASACSLTLNEPFSIQDIPVDPLSQAYMDMRIFETKKNNEVLEDVIKVKPGLRLFQALGKWWLVRSEDNAGSFDYIEYDFETLNFVSQGTYNPVKSRILPSSTGGVHWIDAAQFMQIEPRYGKYILTHDLGFDDNFIDEGRFEEEDVITDGSGNKTFKNWQFNRAQNGAIYGFEFVSNGASKGAFFCDLRNANQVQANNELFCVEIPCSTGQGGIANKFKLSFQYAVYPVFKVPYVRIGWALRMIVGDDKYFLMLTEQGDFEWVLEVFPHGPDDYINDIYVSSFGSFQNIEVLAPGFQDGTISLHLYFHNHYGRDFQNEAEFRAYDPYTAGVYPGQRFIVGDGFYTYFYELFYGNDADSFPQVVRPDDYNSLNPWVWRLQSSLYIGQSSSLVNKILFDNVVISYVPYDVNTSTNFIPPGEAVYSQTVNEKIKQNFESEFLLGDIPSLDNSENIYRGYLRLSDGTPTNNWYRLGVVESKKILNMYLDEVIAQTDAIERITTTIKMSGVYYSFLDSLSYDNRRFINAKYSLNDKRSSIQLEVIEEITGESGEPPVINGAFNTDQFANAYDNGE